MKIRTQLILACLILSILPLTGIVLYSYYSSRTALESAYRQEAQRLTQQMDRRIASIRAELDERLASLSSIEVPGSRSASDRNAMVDSVLMAFGDSAPLIDAVEFIPAPAPTAPTPATPPITHPPATHPPPPPPPRDAVITELRTHPDPDPNPDPDSDGEAPIAEPIVIDLPPVVVPRFEMSAAAQKAMSEISTLSSDLARNATKMSRQERDAKKNVLQEKSEFLEKELDASRGTFQAQMKEAMRQSEERRQRVAAEQERQRAERRAPAVAQTLPAPVAKVVAPQAIAPAPVLVTGQAQTKTRRELSPDESARLRTKEKQASLLFGHRFGVPVEKEGEVVGQIRAKLSTDEVVRRILGAPSEDRREIPFAIDREGNLYARNDDDRRGLEALGVMQRARRGQSMRDIENWIVVMTRDEDSGLRVGVARPVGENLIELKQTAARNFGYGMGLIVFAIIGIVPLANHFTRDVKRVTEGAERIAQGDLQTRLPVRGNDEFGQLAQAFNQMAEDLSENQRKLVVQERARREQEVQQRVFSLEYERKSVELEDARRFQLSMLPKQVPQHELYDVAVLTQTATEVGGDYYDFHVSDDGVMSVTIGDATGHGAKAGTMVTVIKTLFAGYEPDESPSKFLRDAAEKIKRMDLGRMAMALLLARCERSRITIASAGMPPLLVHRAAAHRVEEIALPATPLGTLGMQYEETDVNVAPGDTLLLMTDGLPELQNSEGQQLGYPQAMQEFAAAASSARDADGVIAGLAEAARRWHGDQPPNDDITFVVVRVREGV